MIRYLLPIFLFLFSAVGSVSAQTSSINIPSLVEQMPEYPGGTAALIKEVSSKIVYPKACVDSGIQGKVYVRFVVNEDGSISDINAKGPHPLLKTAAIDAVKTISKFKPGMDKGMPVKVWFSVPLDFTIHQKKQEDNMATAKPDVEVLDKSGRILRDRRTGIFINAEIQPRCVYGDEFFLKDFWKTVRYINGEKPGTVWARMTVTKTGAITDIRIVKSATPRLDEEMIRVIKIMPKFSPALYNGLPVPAYYLLSCDFESISRSGTAAGIYSGYAVQILSPGADMPPPTIMDYYQGGEAALKELVMQQVRYPGNAITTKQDANILVVCRMNDSLKLSPVKVLNDIGKEWSDEAIRLVTKLPAFDSEVRQTLFATEEQVITIPFRLPNTVSAATDQALSNDYYDMGLANFGKGEYAVAITNFTSAIQSSPAKPDAYFNRAIAKMKLNDTGGACDDFRAAYRLGDLDAQKGMDAACK